MSVFSLFLYFLWVMARRSVDILLCGDWQTCSTIFHWLKALSKSSAWLMFTCLYEALFPALVTIRDGSIQQSNTHRSFDWSNAEKPMVPFWLGFAAFTVEVCMCSQNSLENSLCLGSLLTKLFVGLNCFWVVTVVICGYTSCLLPKGSWYTLPPIVVLCTE